ncbi:MAG: DoxX family protein [Acidobacteriaceae bacterium]
MPASTATTAPSRSRLWTSRILSTLTVLFLIMDIVFKFIRPVPPQVLQSVAQLGLQPGLLTAIGVLLLICTVLYVIPATSVLGAVLLTGYLGGAISLQVRVGNPLFGYVLFPVYIGVLMWAGLYLRESRLHALLPLRK